MKRIELTKEEAQELWVDHMLKDARDLWAEVEKFSCEELQEALEEMMFITVEITE